MLCVWVLKIVIIMIPGYMSLGFNFLVNLVIYYKANTGVSPGTLKN